MGTELSFYQSYFKKLIKVFVFFGIPLMISNYLLLYSISHILQDNEEFLKIYLSHKLCMRAIKVGFKKFYYIYLYFPILKFWYGMIVWILRDRDPNKITLFIL